MDISKAIIVVGVIWASLFAWFFRYDVQAYDGVNFARYDRWTGAAVTCNVGGCHRALDWP